jgi:hypothetical protein
MSQVVKVPAAEWLPDLPAHANPGSSEASGVVPRSDKSYGPLASLSALSTTPLSARCQGAFSGRSLGGTVTTFAGDASKLYRLVSGAFSNVSQGGGTPYSTAADATWRFCQAGERVIATNYTNNIQSWTLDSSSAFADLAAAAPRGSHVAWIEPGFLMVGNLSTAANGLHWSGINDPTSWPTLATAAAAAAQSGSNSNLAGGHVQTLLGAIGGAQGAVFMDTAIYRIEYVGPPDIFAFREIERARGTPAPNSVVNVGPLAFYLGEDGFYAFDGSRSVAIGANKVDKTFYSDLDQNNFHRIYAAADPINKNVFWAYPNASASNGNPNRILIYNWETGWWSKSTAHECELIFRSLSQSTNLDSLDALGYNIDTLPYSLDSRVWTGGRLILSAFDTSHNLSNFAGSAVAATVDTAEIDGTEGMRVFVGGIRPLVDGGTITASVGYRDQFSSSVTYTTAASVGGDGFAPQRVSARNVRARTAIAAAGSWSHLWGVEARLRQEGAR